MLPAGRNPGVFAGGASDLCIEIYRCVTNQAAFVLLIVTTCFASLWMKGKATNWVVWNYASLPQILLHLVGAVPSSIHRGCL